MAGVVKQLAGKVPDIEFVDRGRFRLKGFDERWQLFQLAWEEDHDHAASAQAPSLAERTPLVARDAERDQLMAALDAAAAGRGSLVMIGGEPGVGKTRLAEEVMAEARRRGYLTLIGRCFESEGTPPYQPFIEVVEMAASQVEPERLRAALGESAGEIARLLPELRRRFPDIPEPMDLPPEQERRYLFNSVRDFIARAAGVRPICCVFDDLHWADEASLLLLEHIAQNLSSLGVLAIGTYRDVELDLGRPLARTLDGLLRQRLAQRLSLKRLDAGGVRSMLSALGGADPPEPLVGAIYSETEGNPFFVEEVFKHLHEGGHLFDVSGGWRPDLVVGELDVPESVRLVIGRRLERLSEGARAALAAAAVIGRAFSFSLLGRMPVELSEDALFDALDEAERARLLTSTAEGREVSFLFAHELIRQTLLGGLSTLKRQRLHKQVADAIESRYAEEVDTRAAELAHHLLEAGVAAAPGKAAHYLTVAGERALESAAFSQALRFFENALEVIDGDDPRARARTLTGLGAAHRSLGEWEKSRAAWTTAIDIYDELGEKEIVGANCYDMATALAWAFRWEDCLLVAGRGLEALGDGRSQHRVSLLGLSGLIVSLAGNHAPGDAMTREALELAESLDDPAALASARGVRAIHHWAYLQVRDAVRLGVEAINEARERGNLWSFADVGTFTAFALHMSGDDEATLKLVEELEEVTARLGHIQAQNLVRRVRNLCRPIAAAQDWVTYGEEDLARVRDLEGEWMHDAYAYLAIGSFWTGDWDQAIDHYRRAAEEAAKGQPWIWDPVYPGMHFMALAYAGRREEALAVLDSVRGDLPRPGVANSLGSWGLLLAVVEGLVMLGDDEQATGLYPMLLEGLETGARVGYGTRLVSVAAAISAAAGRDWEAADRHFADGREMARSGRPIELGDIAYFQARARLARNAAGAREDADRLLDQAIGIYEKMGMPRHVSMARELKGRVPAG